MSLSLFVVLGFMEMVHIGESVDCRFKDSCNSGLILDLTSLAATTLSGTDGLTPRNTYDYTPCRNALKCGSDTAMALKTKDIEESPCIVMANWNANILPCYQSDREQWVFNYSTGNPCHGSPYNFVVQLQCNPDIGDFRVISTQSYGNCSSWMDIETKWACPGEIYTTQEPEDNSLSGGSIFVIIFFVGFLSYCIFGYIICAILNRKDHTYWDCEANIPHLVFWAKLPSLVIAGCLFSKDFLLALVGVDGDETRSSSDKNENLVSNENHTSNINPFATDDFDE